ncbi:MAG: DUF494 family protein [Ignavibacteriaceae bacterium]|jgi:uncharacterized protein Smg (DUF494 family)
MSSEIVKVLETIVQAINENYSFEDVERSLHLENKKEMTLIAAAYSWIYEKKLRELYLSKALNRQSSKSLRVLSENELYIIGLKNYDYILHFYNIGLVNNSEIEMIIDNIMTFPEEIRTKESINLLILSVILDIDRVSLPGSRYTLYSSDTIN